MSIPFDWVSQPTGACAHALPARAGVGLKPAHFREILENWPDIGFFEVHAENYMVEGGPFHHYLTRIRERYALSVHGVALSIGADAPLDCGHLDALAALLDRYQPQSFSEHLAWSTHGDAFLNDLLPLPYTAATLQRVCEHIDQVQSHLKRRMLLENPATYVEFTESTMDEAEFINEIVRRTGCGLLLDVNNLVVNALNGDRDRSREASRDENHAVQAACAWVDRIDAASVGEIHLAGYLDAGDIVIDDHGSRVHAPVWQVFRHALARLGPRPTLVEWDTDLPAPAVLLAEAAQAEALLAAAAAAAA